MAVVPGIADLLAVIGGDAGGVQQAVAVHDAIRRGGKLGFQVGQGAVGVLLAETQFLGANLARIPFVLRDTEAGGEFVLGHRQRLGGLGVCC